MLESSRDLIEAGGAVVVLRPRDKRPLHEDWTQRPRLTWDEAKKAFGPTNNIGVRLGEPSKIGGNYLLGIDMDIRSTTKRDVAAAWDKLYDLVGNIDKFSSVQSGSGGESRHLYCLSDTPTRTKKLAHSEHKIKDRHGKQHWAWEIDLGGTGRQFVLPPSIHPETRAPYRWDRKIDWLELPVLPAAEIATWLPVDRLSTANRDRAADELAAWYREQPQRFSQGEIEDILDRLSASRESFAEYVEDREGWLSVGMAIHHQSQGEEWGFDLWCAFSNASDKFDPEDQWAKWRSFGKTSGSNNPVTMKSLLYRSRRAGLGDDYGLMTHVEPPEDDLPDDFGARSRRAYDRDRRDTLLDGDDYLSDEHHDRLEAARKQNPREEEQLANAWVRELDVTDAGSIKSTTHNFGLIVANDPRMRGVIWRNEFTHQVVRRKPIPSVSENIPHRRVVDPVNGDDWAGIDDTSLRYFLATPRRTVDGEAAGGFAMKVTDKDLDAAVLSTAWRNRWHPIRSYLGKLRWDGQERVDSLFVRYFGCPDEPYFRDVARLMMVAAVARVHEPGHKWDYAVILEGAEGLRKSSFIRVLSKGWFGELRGEFHDEKKMVEQMTANWIMELPELSGLVRGEVTVVKSFITIQTDKVRLAFERRPEEFPRQCIFIGSTNDQRYLQSETGNRRFMPIPVNKEIDLVRLHREVDQLWAEAYAIYLAMRAEHPATFGPLPLFLQGKAAAAYAAQIQKDRKVITASDIEFGRVQEWLNSPDTVSVILGDNAAKFGDNSPHFVRSKVCAASIFRDMPSFAGRNYTPADVSNINRALENLGWTSGSFHFGSCGRQRGYSRPGATPADIRHGYMRVERRDD